jgi:hypothetical protein
MTKGILLSSQDTLRGAIEGTNEVSPSKKPTVVFVYYSYTQQTLRVVKTMAAVLRNRGVEVALAGIEFTDPDYADRFNV